MFVSSPLGELAEERRAVSRAISTLRLTPVMFETGARPHRPREVYRAYLAQSDVFIGLYWQSYGWIGPDMELSGLHDELELARDKPRLLYIKTPAPDRDPRLAELLSAVEQEGLDSYRTFTTATELGRLVRDDLATLLSERFVATRTATAHASADGRPEAPPSQAPRPASGVLPMDTTSLVGRDDAIDEVVTLTRRPEVRLLTLTGPGGIGKTRLAVAAGKRLMSHYGSGIAFVALAEVTHADTAVCSIGRAVGADLTGMSAPVEALVERLGDGLWLLILDNLEQVVDVAGRLGELLVRCPGVTIIATSRTVLQLQAEHELPVTALPLVADAANASLETLASAPAVSLFVDRARAVRHDFALTMSNASAVADICQRLDGLPLAIELAAARIRLLEPQALLRRLAISLGTLGSGAVDLPERQRTLRATMEWSIELLDDAERSLLEIAAAFANGWTIEAVAEVAELDEDTALDLIDGLHRHSLVDLDRAEFGPRSRMLSIVRDFVAEQLAARPDTEEIRRRHAEYYLRLAERADRPLRGVEQTQWLERLEPESANLATAVAWHLDHNPVPVPHMIRALWLFWALSEHHSQVRPWIDELMRVTDTFEPAVQADLLWTAMVLADNVGDDEGALAAYRRVKSLMEHIDDSYLRAMSHLAAAWTAPIAGDVDGVDAMDLALQQALTSLDMFRDQDEPFWTTLVLTAAASIETTTGKYDDAQPHLIEACDRARSFDSTWLDSWAKAELGTLRVLLGEIDEAAAVLDEALSLSKHSHNIRSVTLGMSGFIRLAAAEGDPGQAALLTGAIDGLRQRVGIQLWPILRPRRQERVANTRAALGDERYEQVYAAGKTLSYQEAVAAVEAQQAARRAVDGHTASRGARNGASPGDRGGG